MTSYASQVKNCPHCKSGLKVDFCTSCNTLDAKFYTDGFVDGPMYDETTFLLICPGCHEYFWLAEALDEASGDSPREDAVFVRTAVGVRGSGYEEADADVKLRAWVMGVTGGYNLWQSARGTLDAIAGARYLEVKVTLDTATRLGPFARQRETTASGEVWDAVIGVKGDITLADNWYAPYYLDVGTGDSDFTWQIAAGVGYRFDWGEVNLVYRYMDWDFQSGGDLDNLNLSGPQLGARFYF